MSQPDTTLLLDRLDDDTKDKMIHTICREGTCNGDWSKCGVPRLDRTVMPPNSGDCPDCLYYNENGGHAG